jgi:broad specificity phosphatase PhoE
LATVIFLLRHAAHDQLGRVLSGRLAGMALGALGRAQATALAERLRRERLDALYTSPIQRCRETAAVIGARRNLEPREAAEATEIDFGAWAGRSFTSLDDDPAWQRWNAARDVALPPGGEGMEAVQARMADLLEKLRQRHEGGCVALVSHADVIKATVCQVLGLSLRAHAAFDVAPASLSALALWPGGGKLLCLNEVPPGLDKTDGEAG